MNNILMANFEVPLDQLKLLKMAILFQVSMKNVDTKYYMYVITNYYDKNIPKCSII